jgi:hypothetical protein
MGGKLIPIIFVALISQVFCQDLAFPKAEEEGNQPISIKVMFLMLLFMNVPIPQNILSA